MILSTKRFMPEGGADMGGRGGSSHRQTAGGTAAIQTFLQNAYGANHANAVLAILQNAPAHIRALWEQYAAQFRATNMRRDEGAFYSPRDDSVHLHIPSVARGDAISTPYSVLFHEYGHMADYLIARGEGYSHISYSDLFQGVGAGGKPILRHGSAGGLLGRTAKDELEGHLSRMRRQNPNMTRDQAARALVSEARGKYSMLDRSDISDMFEGAGIGISHPLGAGHGLDYWSSRGNGKEIFAEILSAEAAHPGSLKAIKEYFPKTYQVYQDMMKARKKR
ncbi:MAG: hypothetical protein PUD16_05230 [bacterium]|nr:hypothetical protein [bacterium]